MAEDRRREPAVRAPRGAARRGAGAVRRRAARSTRSRSSSRSRRTRRSRTSSTATSSTCAAARTSSAPATSRRSSCCRSRARTGAATSATPSCSASTAPRSRRRTELDAHLARIEEAKRRDHRTLGKELDLFSFDDLVGPGFAALAPEGRDGPLPDRGRHPARERPPRLRAGLHAARRARAAARDLRPPRALQGEPVRRHGARRPALPGQADELPVPRRDLPLAAAVVPRPAAALLRARHGLPLRALGRAPRPAARARLHHGRRPPVRARGPDRRRDRPAA